jgi:hypothetical protein
MMRLRKLGSFILSVSMGFLFLNCTPKKIASDLTSQIMAGGAPSFEMEEDVDIAENSGLTMLKMMEAFEHDNPSNKTYHILLARSYANYAFGFLEWNMLRSKGTDEAKYTKNEERAKHFYQKGKEYGLLALNSHGFFRDSVNKDLDTFKKALKGFGRSNVPELFWTALNWGSLINLNKDSPLAIAEFPKVEAIMQRVVDLDPTYFYATPLMFFGVSYGSRPAMFGGNPQKSKDFFEKAIAAYNEKFLMAMVMEAQTLAVQNQDKALFESLLNKVLATDAAVLPEQRLANELAKMRAKFLLDNESQFIP